MSSGPVSRSSVRAKVLGIVATAAAVALSLGAVAIISTSHLRSTTAEMAETQTDVAGSLSDLKDALWTVRNSVSAIYAKLHAAGRAEAIVKAREAGFGRG